MRLYDKYRRLTEQGKTANAQLRQVFLLSAFCYLLSLASSSCSKPTFIPSLKCWSLWACCRTGLASGPQKLLKFPPSFYPPVRPALSHPVWSTTFPLDTACKCLPVERVPVLICLFLDGWTKLCLMKYACLPGSPRRAGLCSQVESTQGHQKFLIIIYLASEYTPLVLNGLLGEQLPTIHIHR